MLPQYLCGLCRRGCKEVDREKCLRAPALNLGCGMMLKPDHINFDLIPQDVDGVVTDILGEARDLDIVFCESTFASIFCAHVIEHFYPQDATKLLKDCFALLRPGGTLVVEAPDIEKIISNCNSQNLKETIQEIYGDPKYITPYGAPWWHKWGWTGQSAADEMKRAGFDVKLVTDGISHNKPKRDFRVEGVKGVKK